MEELSSATVIKLGKNLWENGDVVVDSVSKGITLKTPLPTNITYTLTADVESSDTDNDSCLVLAFPSSKSLGYLSRGKKQSITFTPTADVNKISFYASKNSDSSAGDSASFKNIQLEIGDKSTVFEACKSAEVLTPTEENTVTFSVDGAEKFSLLSSLSGTVVRCRYNKDINKVIKKIAAQLGVEI